MSGPLAGLKVVDAATLFAGPLAVARNETVPDPAHEPGGAQVGVGGKDLKHHRGDAHDDIRQKLNCPIARPRHGRIVRRASVISTE